MPPEIIRLRTRIRQLQSDLQVEQARLRRALIRHLFRIFYLETQVDVDTKFPAIPYPHEDEEQCSVCMRPFNNTSVRLLTCEHVFHTECIDEWIQRSETCPLCRATIALEDTPPSQLLMDTLRTLREVL